MLLGNKWSQQDVWSDYFFGKLLASTKCLTNMKEPGSLTPSREEEAVVCLWRSDLRTVSVCCLAPVSVTLRYTACDRAHR